MIFGCFVWRRCADFLMALMQMIPPMFWMGLVGGVVFSGSGEPMKGLVFDGLMSLRRVGVDEGLLYLLYT